MAGPKETIWKAEPHTLAKQTILRAYLRAWFPILTQGGYGRVLYYDGFAGPGKYVGGEDGSPIIALRAALTTRFPPNVRLAFRFVELDAERADHLESLIRGFNLPAHYDWKVVRTSFAEAVRADLGRGTFAGTPTFAFIDPFGFSGLPFELIRQLLQNQRSEVLITFMKSFVARFPDVTPAAINETIGNPSASDRLLPLFWEKRLVLARLLYHESLSQAARFVRFFEMRDENDVPIYDLFFASNHSLGHYKMKDAMWRADESGQFRFSDGVDPLQLTLLREDPGPRLATVLWCHFRGKTVDAQQVIMYARDHTPYLDQHTRDALKRLENSDRSPCVEIAPLKLNGKKRKNGTFPDGTRITFLDGERK